MTTCAQELGHESCGMLFTEVEHEGHKSSSNSWERSRKKTYYRKIARQQGKGMPASSGPSFKQIRKR